jgi:hypothetical protein
MDGDLGSRPIYLFDSLSPASSVLRTLERWLLGVASFLFAATPLEGVNPSLLKKGIAGKRRQVADLAIQRKGLSRQLPISISLDRDIEAHLGVVIRWVVMSLSRPDERHKEWE